MRILTGVKPSASQIHLGNYFGAIKPMIQLAEKEKNAEIFLFVADMHALTSVFDPEKLKSNIINIVKSYLAAGIDPKRFIIYRSSQIPAHAQLLRIFSCLTNLGYMERMHAFKDAVAKGKRNEVNVGIFTYPILMAADILLYDTNYVPVGKDQKQHLEYARDIAEKFNNHFGETFVLPEAYIQPEVATIPGIDGRKMSKSYNNFIGIFEDEKTILKKIKQIPTSPIPIEEPKNPDECNVYNILKYFLTDKENQEIREKYTNGGLSYKRIKEILFEKIMNFLNPIRQNYQNISDQEVEKILQNGKNIASKIAEQKINQVLQKIGMGG